MRQHFRRNCLSSALVFLLAGEAYTQQPPQCGGQTANHSNIAYSLYFESKYKDAAQCAMTVQGHAIVVDGSVSNPALACPDMFAWKLFADVVSQEFWSNWAADQQTWPGCSTGSPACPGLPNVPTAPLPLCDGSNPSRCCDPAASKNPGYDDTWNPAKYCPYFPGDHRNEPPAAVAPFGFAPSKAHFGSFTHALRFSEPRLLAADPSRKIRQTMSEIVFRNKPMFQFVFEHNLYNQEGLVNVLNNANANLAGKTANPPYRDKGQPTSLAEIDFPVQSIMIKSDWLNEKTALAMGLKDDPPHIKLEIRSPVTDNNGTILEKGVHWLVAMHVSSKDTPNWVWATFEHVANPGRCDYIGCNDSYGYTSPDTSIGTNQLRNYTAPKLTCDNLPLASWVFDTEKQYPGGQITPELAGVLRGMGIGTGSLSMPPNPGDPRWLNYRLKGSQVEFTDPLGRPTRLANSVTEAGFTNSSSCITCHARAGIGPHGTIPLPNGVFLTRVGEQGYGQSANGTPDPSWFNVSGQPPTYRALQSDFVWGVLTALCIDPNFNPNVCSVTPSAPAALRAPTPSAPEASPIRRVIQR